MQREVNTGHQFESRLHIDYSTNNHPPQLHAASDLDCCFTQPVGPRITRKLWSNLCEHAHGKRKKQTEDDSCLRGVEGQLRAAARQGYPNPKDAEDPVIAPPDYDVREFGRDLEL